MPPIRAITLLLLFLSNAAWSQSRADHVLLMNGQELDVNVIGQSTLEVRYMVATGRGLKERSEPTTSVFSVTDTLGRERIWYFQDSLFGNDLTVEQMRWFIKGEQDARNGYKPFWPVLGGFVLGAGLTIGLDLEVNSLAVPPVYAGIMALPRVFITPGSIRDEHMVGNEFYAYGYSKVGRSRRVTRSLMSTAAGVIVGLAVRQWVINPNL